MSTSKTVVGRVERVTFPEADIVGLPAKIDTGAYRSSIWATDIHEEDNTLFFHLLGPSSEFYNGRELSTTEYKIVNVENSFGHSEDRYSVFLSVKVGGKRVRSNFTLADRGSKTYPVLIGRKLLKNRFVVDVAQGNPLEDEEKDGEEDSLE